MVKSVWFERLLAVRFPVTCLTLASLTETSLRRLDPFCKAREPVL